MVIVTRRTESGRVVTVIMNNIQSFNSKELFSQGNMKMYRLGGKVSP